VSQRLDDRSTGSLPLARLFAMSYRWFLDEVHARLAARGWQGVRPAYGFVLLAVRDTALTPTELAARLAVTKQAASKLADAMVADGLLERSPDESDGRQRRLTLSARGRQLLVEVEQSYAELEQQWAEVIGRVALEQTRRRVTTAVVAVSGGALPGLRPLA
jgi:DNA-binding MarR family transcriptional regulator